MLLYNTLTRTEEEFKPSQDNLVRMYACGLTVYSRGHIGNFRSFVAIDVLRRTLKYLEGYKVRHVMNFTDVDDRTIAGSQKAGMPLREYTTQWVDAFLQDAAALGLEDIEERPRATDQENLDEMAKLVRALEANGHTYESDGSIYFKISTLAAVRPARAARSRRLEIWRPRRLGQLRQRQRARFRAVERRKGRRAQLGLRVRARAPRVAPRMLGHGPAAARRASHRHPLRRRRPHLSASRERDRAERGRDEEAVRAFLDARRASSDRRREDVEIARQRVQSSRYPGERLSGIDPPLPDAVDSLSEAAEVQLGDDGSGRGGAAAARRFCRAARSDVDGGRSCRRSPRKSLRPSRSSGRRWSRISTRQPRSGRSSTWCARSTPRSTATSLATGDVPVVKAAFERFDAVLGVLALRRQEDRADDAAADGDRSAGGCASGRAQAARLRRRRSHPPAVARCRDCARRLGDGDEVEEKVESR